MAELMMAPGVPRKVLWKAQQLGVHNDCLISENMCGTCTDHVHMAFEYFYGHAQNEGELIGQILSDIRDDMLEDLDG